MAGVKAGLISGMEINVLISTKENAGCIARAKAYGVPCVIVNRKVFGSQKDSQHLFNADILDTLKDYNTELCFLAGCNQQINAAQGIYFVNNHPAPKATDGGKGMYGTAVHEHVLARIMEEISRHPEQLDHQWRTCIDHHEVISRNPDEKGMDIGAPLSTTWVDIPPIIITELANESTTIAEAAEILQQYVLRYEYLAIISNAMTAVQRVRDAHELGIKLGGY